MRARWISGLAAVALCGCGSRAAVDSPDDLQPVRLSAPSIASRVVGCWSLEWSLTESSGAGQATALPDSVQLRDGVIFGGRERLVSPATHPGGRQATGGGAPAPWESRFRVNRWWVDDDDALRIRFSEEERGAWDVTLDLADGELGGRADYYLEGGQRQSPNEARVRGRRISCDIA